MDSNIKVNKFTKYSKRVTFGISYEMGTLKRYLTLSGGVKGTGEMGLGRISHGDEIETKLYLIKFSVRRRRVKGVHYRKTYN